MHFILTSCRPHIVKIRRICKIVSQNTAPLQNRLLQPLADSPSSLPHSTISQQYHAHTLPEIFLKMKNPENLLTKLPEQYH